MANNRRVSLGQKDPSILHDNPFCTRVLLINSYPDPATNAGNQHRAFKDRMNKLGWYPRIGTSATFFWKRSDQVNWRPGDEALDVQHELNQTIYPEFSVTFAVVKPVNDNEFNDPDAMETLLNPQGNLTE